MKRLSLKPTAIGRARALRRSATAAETRLWNLLRTQLREAKFRRQVPIGPYFADFASHGAKLIVEVDGGQHSAERDAARTTFLQAEGYRVLRFWNNEVLQNLDGVLAMIAKALFPRGRGLGEGPAASAAEMMASPANESSALQTQRAPTPCPPHKGEGVKRQPMVGVR